MTRMTAPGILGYAVMAIWLLVVATAPAAAADAAPASRIADHLAEIRAALVTAGAPPSARITLAAPDALAPIDAATRLPIDSASFNPATGRFLMRARLDPSAAPLAITGVAIATATLPAPTRDIARGEIINETDLDWIDIADPRASLYLDDADAIIGKLARRPLAAGAPLRKADLAAPVLIKRGAVATIILEAPGIRLTQNAVALANGGAGDLIAFRNVSSNIEIKGVVIAEGLAKAPFRNPGIVASLD